MKGPLYGGLFCEYSFMTSLIILLVIVAVYVCVKRAFPDDEIRRYKYISANEKIEVNSVFDIATLLYSRGERLRGLQAGEIEHLMQTFNTPLPYCYREFLHHMGRGAGDYMVGSSVFIDELYNLKEWAKGLCKENGIPDIPENAFVFWMHQGYQAFFFIPEEGVDDPEVYYFTEGGDGSGFVNTGHSFLYFLKIELVRLYPELEEKLLVTPTF